MSSENSLIEHNCDWPPSMHKLNSILLHKTKATYIKTYPCTVPLLSNANCSGFMEGILPTLHVHVMSLLREWCLWMAPVGEP